MSYFIIEYVGRLLMIPPLGLTIFTLSFPLCNWKETKYINSVFIRYSILPPLEVPNNIHSSVKVSGKGGWVYLTL